MMDRKPPKLAIWLLNTIGGARHNSALVGDFLEEFRNGRSPSWFWRQTTLVLARMLVRHLWECAMAALFIATPDLVFGLLNRPPQHRWVGILTWCAGAIMIAGLWIAARRRKRFLSSGWAGAGFISATLAFLLLTAWDSTDSLAQRMWKDGELWLVYAVFLPIGSALREKLRKSG